MKQCKKCLINKPLDSFYPHKETKDHHSSWCKSCFSQSMQQWKKEHPDRTKQINQRYVSRNKDKVKVSHRNWLIKQYGLTAEAEEKLLVQQNYSCAICHTSQSELKRKLHIDHNHKTNVVRGLLCQKCNLLLGHSNDQISILASAIMYLTKSHPTHPTK